jgi:hypothetical protein
MKRVIDYVGAETRLGRLIAGGMHLMSINMSPSGGSSSLSRASIGADGCRLDFVFPQVLDKAKTRMSKTDAAAFMEGYERGLVGMLTAEEETRKAGTQVDELGLRESIFLQSAVNYLDDRLDNHDELTGWDVFAMKCLLIAEKEWGDCFRIRKISTQGVFCLMHVCAYGLEYLRSIADDPEMCNLQEEIDFQSRMEDYTRELQRRWVDE